jgi:hypothetical protein
MHLCCACVSVPPSLPCTSPAHSYTLLHNRYFVTKVSATLKRPLPFIDFYPRSPTYRVLALAFGHIWPLVAHTCSMTHTLVYSPIGHLQLDQFITLCSHVKLPSTSTTRCSFKWNGPTSTEWRGWREPVRAVCRRRLLWVAKVCGPPLPLYPTCNLMANK